MFALVIVTKHQHKEIDLAWTEKELENKHKALISKGERAYVRRVRKPYQPHHIAFLEKCP